MAASDERPATHGSARSKASTAKARRTKRDKEAAKKEREAREEELVKQGSDSAFAALERSGDDAGDDPVEGADALEPTPSEVENDIPDDERVSMAFRDLRQSMMDKLAEMDSADEIAKFMAARFGLEDYDTNLRTSVLVDFYTYNFMFAREARFSAEQASAVFSIIKMTHERAVSSGCASREALMYLKKLLVQHSAPPKGEIGTPLFSIGEVQQIVEYAMTTYFGHYTLYHHVCTGEQEVNLVLIETSLETPALPVPHSQGITVDEHERRIEEARVRELEEAAERQRQEELEKVRQEEERRRLEREQLEQRDQEARKKIGEYVADAISGSLDEIKGEIKAAVDDQESVLQDRVATLEQRIESPDKGNRLHSPSPMESERKRRG